MRVNNKMKKFFYKLKQKNKEGDKSSTISLRNGAGFTLLEMIVAVGILVGAVMGPITVVVNGINVSTGAKNRILANYLAMEALETLKNKQYRNFLMGEPGSPVLLTNGIVGASSVCVSSPGTCKVDAWTNSVSACNITNDECKLKVAIVGNEIKYGYDVTWTTFASNNLKRWYNVQITSAEQLLVTVTVEWTEKGSTKTVTAKDYFQNWGG